MAELEIHHESEHKIDPAGQKVGILAAVLAVLLAIVTIASHRTHTASIIFKSSSNDTWSEYQSARLKLHNTEMARDLIAAIGAKGAESEKLLASYEGQSKKYEGRSKELQEKAEKLDGESEAAEHRGLRFDLGEGLLEIALVLSSLYFISHKGMFPVLGAIAGVAGIVLAITGFLV